MKLNLSREWLLKATETENENNIISVGGLVSSVCSKIEDIKPGEIFHYYHDNSNLYMKIELEYPLLLQNIHFDKNCWAVNLKTGKLVSLPNTMYRIFK